ncbi:DUF4249 domain-containing protein [Roseimarinus sediminis]|uniref:DUF4249 domain-containing protein n=1 Tax=Roseimarinus sediminis TaxID=1610899 RepID=UPI003D199352
MQTINKLYLVLLMLVTVGCIDRFYLEDHEVIGPKLVISGMITDGCGVQEISVSQSSSTEQPLFHGVSGCNVQVLVNGSETVWFSEDASRPGYYTATMPEELMLAGASFQLEVETYEGKQYRSTLEELLPSPEIDSLYYAVEARPTAQLGDTINGVQFFMDYRGSDFFSGHYRMLIDECYEFHATWPKEYYMETYTRLRGPIDYSTYTCYKTNTVDELFTLSTEALSDKIYRKKPLHFVSDYTQRLMYNYSILVRQQSLSKAAYQYWENIRKNNKEADGLFTTQPAMVRGNIRNESDSSEIVLGYFGVASEATRRLTIKGGFSNFEYLNVRYCNPIIIEMVIPSEPRPLYLIEVDDPSGIGKAWAWAPTECFDCTLTGGVLEKPDFFE